MALRFDGSTDYVLIPGTVYSTNQGTASVWFKLDQGPITGVIIGGVGVTRSPTLWIDSVTRDLVWEIGLNVTRDTNSPVNFGLWNHAAITWKNVGGTVSIRVYLNGNLVQTGTDSTFGAFFTQIHLGHYANSGSNFWTGYISNFAAYSVDLDDTEIRMLYQSRSKSIVVSRGLIGHWRLDEGNDGQRFSTRGQAIDISSSGLHGVAPVGSVGMTYIADDLLSYT